MKDYGQKAIEERRPSITALDGVNFCLRQLYTDKAKTLADDVVQDLTFEELIGALLVARDELEVAAADD